MTKIEEIKCPTGQHINRAGKKPNCNCYKKIEEIINEKIFDFWHPVFKATDEQKKHLKSVIQSLLNEQIFLVEQTITVLHYEWEHESSEDYKKFFWTELMSELDELKTLKIKELKHE